MWGQEKGEGEREGRRVREGEGGEGEHVDKLCTWHCSVCVQLKQSWGDPRGRSHK